MKTNNENYIPYGDEWAKLLLHFSYKRLEELAGNEIKHKNGQSKEDFIQDVRRVLINKKAK